MGSSGWGGELTRVAYGDDGADAAQAAGMEQQQQAGRNYRTFRDQMSTATVQGLNSLDQDISNQQKNLDRQTQLISQLDPTIIEASQQALKLLRGESSSTLAPIQAQRDTQRQQLLSSLREQLGPGAETSTAGMQALNQFDQQTNSLMSQQQQSALGTLGQVGQQFTSQRPDMLREIMGMSSLGQGKYQLGANQAQGLFTAAQPLVQMSGADQIKKAQMGALNTARTNAWGDSSFKFGESMASMGGGSGGSKSSGGGGYSQAVANDYGGSSQGTSVNLTGDSSKYQYQV